MGEIFSTLDAYAAEDLHDLSDGLVLDRVAERLFDLRVWEHGTAGGHFAAWEQPAQFVDGVRAALELT